jgi:hypothetical protein
MNCVMAIMLIAQYEPPEGGPSLSWISCLSPLVVIGLVYWGVRNWNKDTSDSEECSKDEKDQSSP